MTTAYLSRAVAQDGVAARDGPRALDAGPAVIFFPASSALAPRGDVRDLFHLELAHHLYDVLEGLLVFEAV